MSHFFLLASAVAPLAAGVIAGASGARLVAPGGGADRFPPPRSGAVLRAVDLAMVAAPADPDQPQAVPTVEDPVTFRQGGGRSLSTRGFTGAAKESYLRVLIALLQSIATETFGAQTVRVSVFDAGGSF